ncbi:Protein NUCLEAR FUSION DEFECTIVE 4 [Diplonema papillatum]|nr:Protein NUCLEAR FUSION DEFECTIVE 4 [Diplonema papillatum]
MGCGFHWNAWVSLSASLTIQFCAGNLYLFGIYSERLKAVLFAGDGLGQGKLQTVALASNLFAFMPLAGIWYDSKLGGVTSTVLVGACLTFSGYFLLYRVANGWDCGWILACLFAGLLGHGAGYYDAAALTTAVKNAPTHQALVVGVQKSLLSLSGCVVAQAGSAFYAGDPAGFTLFLGAACAAPAAAAGVFLCEATASLQPGDPATRRRFARILSSLAAVAAGFVALSAVRAARGGAAGLGRPAEVGALAGAVLFLAVLLAWVAGLFGLPGGMQPKGCSQRKYTYNYSSSPSPRGGESGLRAFVGRAEGADGAARGARSSSTRESGDCRPLSGRTGDRGSGEEDRRLLFVPNGAGLVGSKQVSESSRPLSSMTGDEGCGEDYRLDGTGLVGSKQTSGNRPLSGMAGDEGCRKNHRLLVVPNGTGWVGSKQPGTESCMENHRLVFVPDGTEKMDSQLASAHVPLSSKTEDYREDHSLLYVPNGTEFVALKQTSADRPLIGSTGIEDNYRLLFAQGATESVFPANRLPPGNTAGAGGNVDDESIAVTLSCSSSSSSNGSGDAIAAAPTGVPSLPLVGGDDAVPEKCSARAGRYLNAVVPAGGSSSSSSSSSRSIPLSRSEGVATPTRESTVVDGERERSVAAPNGSSNRSNPFAGRNEEAGPKRESTGGDGSRSARASSGFREWGAVGGASSRSNPFAKGEGVASQRESTTDVDAGGHSARAQERSATAPNGSCSSTSLFARMSEGVVSEDPADVTLASISISTSTSKNASTETSALLSRASQENATLSGQRYSGEESSAALAGGLAPSQALRTVDFWLLFAVLFIGTGGGLAIINNAAQIVISNGGTGRDTTTAVSLLYACNCFGRILLCAGAETLGGWGLSWALVFSLMILLHAAAQAVLLVPSTAALYLGFCLVGVSYGGIQSAFPAVVTDLCGLRSFSSNYTSLTFAPSLGSLVFSTLVASSVYKQHQKRDPDTGVVECVGKSCYFLTHVIICCACVVGAGLGLVLHRRTQANTRASVASTASFSAPTGRNSLPL